MRKPRCTVTSSAGERCTRTLWHAGSTTICKTHLNRFARHGSVLADVPIRPYATPTVEVDRSQGVGETDVERFWNRVEKTGHAGCWVWTGGVLNSGYGQAWFQGMTMCAHRVTFELANGYRPTGRRVAQRCGNQLCVNPDHLFIKESRGVAA